MCYCISLPRISPADPVWVVRLGFIILLVCVCMHARDESVFLSV